MADIIGSVVTDFTSRGAPELQATFDKMVQLGATLTTQTQTAIKGIADLHAAWKKNPSDEALANMNTGIITLGRNLKSLGNSDKGLDIVRAKDIDNVKEINKVFKDLEILYLSLKKNAEIDAGVFGLNPKSMKDAKVSLQELESKLNSVKGAMGLPGADVEKLRAFELQIKRNTGALIAQAEALRTVQTLAKAQESAVQMNGVFDKRKSQQYSAAQDTANVMNETFNKKASARADARDVKEDALDTKIRNDALVMNEQINKRNESAAAALADRKAKAAIAAQERANAVNAEGERGIQYNARSTQDRANVMNETFNKKASARADARDVKEDALDTKIRNDALVMNEQINKKREAAAAKAAQKLQDAIDKQAQTIKESTGSASFQAQNDKLRLNYSALGNAYQQQQSGMQYQGITQALRPPVADARFGSIENTANKDVLKNAYGQAGMKWGPSEADVRDSDKLRTIKALIRDLDKEIIKIRESGVPNAQAELALLNRIRDLKNDSSKTKQDDRISDPVQRGENQNRQALNMLSKVDGVGAAALLRVQMALMANYSILNGAIAGMKSSITHAVELEAAFKNLQAVTATTSHEMVGMEKTIRDIAGATKFSAVEVAAGALILGQAGLSTKQIGEALQPVVMLATAAGTSIAQAVELVTSVIGVYNKAASETGDIANKITQAANSSKVSVEKLAAGFQYAGNISAQLGVSFEETTAAMAAMANAGIHSGSTMGTGLRQFLNELEKPSASFIGVINKIGLSISDIDLRSQGLSGVLRNLSQAGFVAQDAIKSFDVRGAAAFNALLANPADFERQLSMLHDTQAAAKANEVQMESLKNQGLRLGSAINNVVSIGFEPFAKVLTIVTSALATLFNVISEHEVVLGILGTVMASFVATMAISHITMLFNGFMVLNRLVQTTAVSMGVATGATQGLTVATKGLSTAMISTGLGALLVLGGYLISYVMQAGNAKDETDRLTAKFNEAKGAVEEKKEAIKALTQKIDELSLREALLTDGSMALKNEALDINQKFALWGLTIDSNNTSLGEMVAKMQALREQMQNMQLRDMDAAVAEAKSVAKDSMEQGEKARAKYGTETWYGKEQSTKGLFELQTLVSRLTNLPGEVGQKSELAALLAELKGGKKVEDLNHAGTGSAYLTSLRKDKGVPEELRDIVTATAAGVLEMVQAGSKIRGDLRALGGQESDRDAKANYIATNRASGANGETFEDIVTKRRNLDAEAKKNLPAGASLLQVNEEIHRLVTTYDKVLEAALSKAKLLPGASATTIQDFEDKVAKAKSGLRVSLKNQSEYALAKLELTDSEDKKLLSSKKKLLESRMHLGRMNDNDVVEAKAAAKDIADKAFTKKTLGLPAESDVYKTHANNRDAEISIAYLAVDDKAREAHKRITMASLAEEAKAFAQVVKEAEAKAADYKGRATPDMGQEEILELMNLGLKELEKAHKAGFKALNKKTARTRTKMDENVTPEEEGAWSLEQRSFEKDYDNKRNAFANGFTGVLVSAAGVMYKQSLKLKTIQNRINQAMDESDQRLYDANFNLRNKDAQLAISKGPVSSRHVSGATAEVQEREREPILLDSLTKQLAEKQTQLQNNKAAKAQVEEDLLMLQVQNSQAASKAKDLLAGRAPHEMEGKADREQWEAAKANVEASTKAIEDAKAKYHAFSKTVLEVQGAIDGLNGSIAGMTRVTRDDTSLSTIKSDLQDSYKAYQGFVADMDSSKVLSEGALGVAKNFSGNMATAFSNIVTGTKSVKGAFRDMASGMIKAMIDIMAQALAMQAIKGLMGLVMNMTFAGASNVGGMDVGVTSQIGGDYSTTAATGGYVTNAGTIERVRRMASGGEVAGGTPGRDSVPALLMPGEFVMKTSAVNAVGTDYLHSLNASTNSVASAGTSSGLSNQGAPSVTNVWVVTPDQKPGGLTAQDVVVVISDDIMRNGSVKKLIKQVVQGQV